MMRRQVLATALAVAVVAAAGTAFAQGQQPAVLKNLQVFPKDAPRDVVIAAMKNFTRALGVRCQHMPHWRGRRAARSSISLPTRSRENRPPAR